MGRGSCSLTKWYIDVATADGRVAIAYWAQVRWRRLSQPLCGLLLHDPDRGATPWRFSGRFVLPPAFDAYGLRWSAEPLALTVTAAPRQAAVHERLLDSPDGAVTWFCEAPLAEVRLEAGDTVVEGLGYVERIEMSLLPWRIPADAIRWGRFLADDTSVVWIDWRGECPKRLVFRDGRPMSHPVISDDAVRADGLELLLCAPRVVGDDSIGGLLAPLEALRPLVAPIARTRQTRWLSRAECRDARGSRWGWALHELVQRM